ncbi:hypothetical protein MUU74_00375 [Chryseobacterium daecheongense]|uniref:hypothetical protein n=1 Tax=Chryseobacterium daecheongense TaxID=192389 RepID=UPI001FD68B78|nr:hypothetical protein [Chryseobacterium daecheongense]UOU98437.1 hypothetical protein MUU74_00375 [Chryseobacterium daecheongense]
MMNAKTQIRKRVTNDALLENRIRLIFFIHFCLFISINVYGRNTIKSIDGKDVVSTDHNMAMYNTHFFDSEELFNPKNVFDDVSKTEIIVISLLCFSNIKTAYNKIFFSDFLFSLISDNQLNKNISKLFISHNYDALRPPPSYPV